MESLTDFSGFYWDLGFTVAEILLLIVAFTIVYLIVRGVLRRAGNISFLRNRQDNLAGLRRKIRAYLLGICFLLCAGVVAFNAYLIYRKVDVHRHVMKWLHDLPPKFWPSLAINIAKVAVLVVVGRFIIKLIRHGLMALQERAKAYEQIKANDESIEAFFGSLNKIQTKAIWLLVAGVATKWLPFPPEVPDFFFLILRIYLIVAIGLLIVKAVAVIVDSLDALSVKYSSPENFLRFYDRLRVLVPLARRCLEFIVYVYVATLVVMQLDFIAQFAVYGPRAVKIIGIFFLSRVVIELAHLMVEESMLKGKDMTDAERQRRHTLVPLVTSFLRYIIYFVAFVLILGVLQFNPTPFLAGAGILGLVVGLGCQSLINDIVTGFFILFENIYLSGDYIETGAARGTVEAIDIRTTRIRDPNGQLHILRNGQIGEVVNYSKTYTNAVVEVGVSYDSNLDKVYKVLADVGRKLKDENQDVLASTVVHGLDKFGESDLVIRTATQVKPGRHAAVARDFRKRVKEAFDREGIEIPFARRVIIFKNEPPSAPPAA